MRRRRWSGAPLRGAQHHTLPTRLWGLVLGGLAWSSEHEALLYGLSALLAGVNLVVASSSDYRAWALVATPAYALAAMASLALRRVGDPKHVARARRIIAGLLLVSVVIAPLAQAVVARALALPGVHAQAEVAVIERCGDRVAAGHDCYLAHPVGAGTAVRSAAPSSDASAFVPYLPAMAIFGLANASSLPLVLRDARIWMVAFTLVVLILGAKAAKLPRQDRWMLIVALCVLPSGALPMVTGGDDLPVVALLAVGLLLAGRRPRLASLAFAGALTLKLTAWPVVAILLLVRDPAVERRRLLVPAFLLGGAVDLVGIVANPSAFILNNLLFPLGFTPVRSPAQSPLLGQLMISLTPRVWHQELVGILVMTGVVATAIVVRLAWPLNLDRAIVAAAAIFTLAVVLAPQTRFGYLLYPFDLLAIVAIRRSATPAPTSPCPAREPAQLETLAAD